MANNTRNMIVVTLDNSEQAVIGVLKGNILADKDRLFDKYTDYYKCDNTKEWSSKYLGAKWLFIESIEQQGDTYIFEVVTAWATAKNFFDNLQLMILNEYGVETNMVGEMVDEFMNYAYDYNNGELTEWSNERMKEIEESMYM